MRLIIGDKAALADCAGGRHERACPSASTYSSSDACRGRDRRLRCDGAVATIARRACAALHDELGLYPKPGLVSFVDTGSHADMDAGTFMASLFALRPCFEEIAALGAARAAFGELEQAGRRAEQRMLLATGGVNTHRGAIFSLGLLCAAAGSLVADGTVLDAAAVRTALVERWGAALARRVGKPRAPSHGILAAQRYGLCSAGEEAASGLPVLFDITFPALRAALARGLGRRRARLLALLRTMAVLDDTNLVHRGGIDGLRAAQRAARDFLRRGGFAAPGALEQLEAMHREFAERRLSPGGSADMLAAACWLQRVCA